MKQTTLSNIAKLLSISLSGSALMLQPAMANIPDTHIFNQAPEIPDEMLADMRGRYAGPGEFLYFGVDMVTQWQTADGRLLNSGVSLSVDRQFVPTITIVTESTASGSGGASQATAGNGNVTISGGLGNVSGVAQSIQIGGDGNAIRNDINMNIKLNANGEIAQSGASNGNGIALNGAGTTAVEANGSTTTVTLSGNNLSMAVDVAGQGQVLQQLRGGTNGNAGFLQSTRIGGDLNQIHNVININASMSGASGTSSAPGVQAALETLRGIRSAGAF